MPPALSSSALLSLALAATLPAHGQAQAGPDGASSGAVQPLPAITVSARADAATEGTDAFAVRSTSTATRMYLSPRETPQSITVLTHAVVQDFSLANVNDLLSLATGVNVERVEPDRSYFSVRGFEVSNFQVDGVGLPFATGDQLGDLDTVLHDRVEILRGANGLVTATGNPSATVNFVRKRPTAHFQASAALTLGSWNDRRAEADVSGALGSAGSVRGRLIVAGEEKDSWLARYSLKKSVAGGVVEADLTDNTLLAAGISRQYNLPRGTMWGALPLAYSDGTPTNYDRSASTGTSWTYWASEDSQAFAELTHQLPGDWQAKATLTRRLIASDAELLYLYGDPDASTGEGLFSYPSRYGHTERQWIGDVHATGPFTLAGRRHELMLGFSGGQSINQMHSSDDDVGLPLTEDEMLAGSFARPAFDEGITGNAHFKNRQASLYAATRLNLADDLKVFAGATLTRTTSVGEQYGEAHDFAKTRTTPYAGIVYDLAPGYSVYGSYTAIFNPQYQTDVSNKTLDPIEGSNAELGAKGEWLGGKLTGSAAVFQTRQDNTAVYAGWANGRSYYSGVDATSTGFELDVAGQIAQGWELSAGYTLLALKDPDGHDVRTYVPRRTLRASTSYRLPMLPALKLGASVKWQSEISNGTARQDAYALLDLMAGYEFHKNLSLTASLRNATDESYLTSLLWAQSYRGAPRNLLVTLRWTY
ncbi:TonB-dependent siderophore receptor [Ideonella sp. YS5]|uniref:TonB-dependent siderophore receptor n=1 Tax=Ideonella sp. YS5 TaxID=3453714 RepID=UPI003EED4741